MLPECCGGTAEVVVFEAEGGEEGRGGEGGSFDRRAGGLGGSLGEEGVDLVK